MRISATPKREMMARHWVKALTIVVAPDEHGVETTYYPGDWLQVRNMQMRVLLANNQIEVMERIYRSAFQLGDCGIVVIGDGSLERAKEYVSASAVNLDVVGGPMRLEFPRTLLWDGETPLRLELLPVAFNRLKTGWQVTAPLLSYTRLARDFPGNDGTEAVIRDLRVPVYDTRSVYVRRCPDTERMVEMWEAERAKGGDDRLAFLRALYRNPLAICAQPVQWVRDGTI